MDGLPHVMISYQWDSQKQVLKLRDKLKKEGFEVWMDVDKMDGDILDAMSDAVEKADVILACISHKYQHSKSCKTEAKYAFKEDKPIVPIKVNGDFEPSGWLGALVGTSLYYFIDSDQALDKKFPDLLRSLKKIKAAPTVSAPTPVTEKAAGSAPSSSSKSKRGERKALTCFICLGRFRTPKTLPCLHSFCKECLLGWAPYGTKTVSCPQCREVATVPYGDVNKFKTNFHLRELVEEEALQMASSDSIKFTCTCCDEDKESQAVGKCQDCRHYICSSSLEAHQKFPELKKHNVVLFDNENTAPKPPSSPSAAARDKPSAPAKPELSKTVWETFDALYNEDHSGMLLKYWMQQNGEKKGWQTAMINQYMSSLHELEEDCLLSEDALSMKQEKVAIFFKQAGQYKEALTLVNKIIDIETKELGARPERLADLYGLASVTHMEIYKQTPYVIKGDPKDLATICNAIRNARKSIKLRKTLPGDDDKFQLGKILVVLTLGLFAWIEIGEDPLLNIKVATEEAKSHIGNAIEIFKELDSNGNLAEAIMTDGVLACRGDENQEKLYMEAYRLCIQAYGEESVLAYRLTANIGNMYVARQEYHEAYNWYTESAETLKKVFGYHHEKTEHMRNMLKEPKYAAIERELANSE